MSDLLTLAQAAEWAAAEEQRELLIAAWEAINGARLVSISAAHVRAADGWTPFQRMLQVEAWESASLMLVPTDGCLMSVRHLWDGEEGARAGHAIVHRYGPDGEEPNRKFWLEDFCATAATPALAIVAAALRARASMEEG